MIKKDVLPRPGPHGGANPGPGLGGEAKVKRAWLLAATTRLWGEREALALFVASHTEGKGQDKWIVSRSLAS